MNAVDLIRDLILHLIIFVQHSFRVAFLRCFDFQYRLGHGHDLQRTLIARFLISREGVHGALHGALHSNDSAGKQLRLRHTLSFDPVQALGFGNDGGQAQSFSNGYRHG